MFNTEAIYDAIGIEILRRRGFEMTDTLKSQMMGRRSQEALQFMIECHSLTDTVPELLDESFELFFELAVGRLAPMPGLYELLDRIELSGLPKGVATSSSRTFLSKILGQYELEPRFHMTLTAEDVTHGKPHPEIYLTAAKRLGVEPGEMLVLEDSQTGTNAAAAAGAVVLSVPHEYSRMHDFSRAAQIVNSLHDPRVFAYLS